MRNCAALAKVDTFFIVRGIKKCFQAQICTWSSCMILLRQVGAGSRRRHHTNPTTSCSPLYLRSCCPPKSARVRSFHKSHLTLKIENREKGSGVSSSDETNATHKDVTIPPLRGTLLDRDGFFSTSSSLSSILYLLQLKS